MNPRFAPWIAAAGALAAVIVSVGMPSAAGVAPERTSTAPTREVLDERRADFLEDDDPSRIVAALSATLAREGGTATLTITASAVGPRVDPPPGFEGVRGTNLIAAEEIEAILAKGRAEVRVRGPGGAAGHGRATAGRAGEIVERRLLPDGRVEHAAAGGRSRIVEAVFEAPLVGVGEFVVEVVVDGHVRARATGRLGRETGRIASIEGVAEHPREGAKP